MAISDQGRRSSAVWEGTPKLKVVHDVRAAQGGRGRRHFRAGRSLLDEIVRDGTRAMLAAALQAEVAAYVEAHGDQLDEHGRRLVVGTMSMVASCGPLAHGLALREPLEPEG